MKSSTVSQGFVRCTSRAKAFLAAYSGKTLNKQRLSVAMGWLAVIIVWSTVIAMSVAVAGFLLGER